MWIGIIIFFIIWAGVGIVLWVIGTSKRSKAMVLFGSFMCLGIIGLIITIITTSSWDREMFQAPYMSLEAQKLALERQQFELEKQKFAVAQEEKENTMPTAVITPVIKKATVAKPKNSSVAKKKETTTKQAIKKTTAKKPVAKKQSSPKQKSKN